MAVPVTWFAYKRVKKKDPQGIRTWWFAIHRQERKAQSKLISFHGNFKRAAEYAVEAAKQVKDAIEIVVLIP